MGWKDDKDLTPWSVVKTSWGAANVGPDEWNFTKSPADNRYSEGDKMTDSSYPVWDLPDNNKTPILPVHFVCGYWINVYSQGIVLTTPPYPVEVLDEFKSVSINLIAGNFRDIYQRYGDYDYEDEFESLSTSLISGTFTTKNNKYSYDEEFENVSMTLLSGTFRDALENYSFDEEFENKSIVLVSGTFRDALIKYSYEEEFESKTTTLISGTHS